eukprot:TRINITY_DN7620_c0_g1_i1.p1 TRINITY_DN7620_c0_g1~~TRINITY_DN7620_c0_g1_i1.p1  ORF type:complete len:325 (-),score=53.14 TRINITY_DN7620_c0_g1_i1:76-1050(-)
MGKDKDNEEISHCYALWHYILMHHPIAGLFYTGKKLTKKEKLFLLIVGIILGLSIQCCVQWLFLNCHDNNENAFMCRDYCTNSFGESRCSSSEASLLSGYYYFNSSGVGWQICNELVLEKIANQEPELTYQDACVHACIEEGFIQKISLGFLTGLDITADYFDHRPKCEAIPASRRGDILCRDTTLDCGSMRLLFVKAAIGLAITLPLSLLLSLMLRVAHWMDNSPKCENCCSCCSYCHVRSSYVIVAAILAIFVTAGLYSFIQVVVYYNTPPGDIFKEFGISYAGKQLSNIFLWGGLYFLCCGKHRRDLEKEKDKSEVEMHKA